MKNLKLELGKTYVNRKGNEVKIVRKDNTDRYPYQGSNGRWYTEAGQWCNAESHYDLIEEVPEINHSFGLVAEALTPTRYIFKIPDGVKEITASQEGNRIIVEMVPEDKGPKPGDIVFEDGRIMIVKKYPNLYHAMIHGNPDYLHINDSYGIPFTSATFRLATAEEAQLLLDALKKAGKRWNPETMEVEEIPEIDRIREWTEKHYSNHQGIAEAIEAYLKYRGGK